MALFVAGGGMAGAALTERNTSTARHESGGGTELKHRRCGGFESGVRPTARSERMLAHGLITPL